MTSPRRSRGRDLGRPARRPVRSCWPKSLLHGCQRGAVPAPPSSAPRPPGVTARRRRPTPSRRFGAPVCGKVGTAGTASPCPFPGSQRSLFPWVPGPVAWPGRGCAPAEDRCLLPETGPRRRGRLHSPGPLWPPTGIQKPNVRGGHFLCVSVCLSDFSTGLITVVKLTSGGVTRATPFLTPLSVL